MNFGERLKEIRLQKDYSLYDVKKLVINDDFERDLNKIKI